MGKDPFIDDLPFDMVIFHSYISLYQMVGFPCSAIVILWCYIYQALRSEIIAVCSQPVAVPSKQLAFFRGTKTTWRWTSFAATLQWAPVKEDSMDAIHAVVPEIGGSAGFKNDTLLGHIDHIYLYHFSIYIWYRYINISLRTIEIVFCSFDVGQILGFM